MAMIMTGVANTGGKIASLKRLARCSAVTTSVNEPLAPTGIYAMRLLLWTCHATRTVPRIVIDDRRTTCSACGMRSVAAETGQLEGDLIRAQHDTHTPGFNGADGHAGKACR